MQTAGRGQGAERSVGGSINLSSDGDDILAADDGSRQDAQGGFKVSDEKRGGIRAHGGELEPLDDATVAELDGGGAGVRQGAEGCEIVATGPRGAGGLRRALWPV